MKFFNTLTGKTEIFEPLNAGEVTLYTCGPTVYDFAHIGNFRTFVFEDLLRRYLEYKGYRVKHTMNLTDVDDKTIAGAQKEGVPLDQFTEKYIRAFHEDLRTLNILTPNWPSDQPRATREIPGMIRMIETLIQKEIAYESDSSVYFRVSKFPGYGKLSKKDLDCNRESVRVDNDEYEKETGADFVLWKKSKSGEPAWDSPWGPGRPGWHIECSAMSMRYLGETLDIHAGGEDLVFPHHENEIAQSEACSGKPFVRFWLHSRFLLVNGEKMSKSKGNFYTLRDLVKQRFDPLAIRHALLSVHYRTALNFTLEGIQASRQALTSMRAFYSSVMNHQVFGRGMISEDHLGESISQVRSEIEAGLDDDLNISKALAAFFKWMDGVDRKVKAGQISAGDWSQLKVLLSDLNFILGIVPDEDFDSFPENVKRLYWDRKNARMEKRFQDADQLRQKISELGFLVWDEAKGLSGIAR